MGIIPATVPIARRGLFWVGSLALAMTGGGAGWAQETMAEYALSSPMVIEGKQGVVIENLKFRRRLSPLQASVQIRNSTNVVVRTCSFAGTGPALLIENSQNVQIQDCAFLDLWEHTDGGPRPQIAIEVHFSRDIGIADSLFEFVSTGLYAFQSQQVVFTRNMVCNVLGPFPRGQAAQFNQVRGPGSRISENFVRNESGISAPQDCFNLFQSYGSPDSPILVEDNYLAGDPEDGSRGQSFSGSGIMAGDGGGGFQTIRNNRLDGPGQVGIGVAAGGDILVMGNTIRGTSSDVSNVGIAVWSQYRQPGGRVAVISNTVGWRNREGRLNGIWVGKSKYGPAYEFTEIRQTDNQILFPEEMEVKSSLTPAPWMMTESLKYSRRLRQARGDLEKLFDPAVD